MSSHDGRCRSLLLPAPGAASVALGAFPMARRRRTIKAQQATSLKTASARIPWTTPANVPSPLRLKAARLGARTWLVLALSRKLTGRRTGFLTAFRRSSSSGACSAPGDGRNGLRGCRCSQRFETQFTVSARCGPDVLYPHGSGRGDARVN